jgi:hypothetical protein
VRDALAKSAECEGGVAKATVVEERAPSSAWVATFAGGVAAFSPAGAAAFGLALHYRAQTALEVETAFDFLCSTGVAPSVADGPLPPPHRARGVATEHAASAKPRVTLLGDQTGACPISRRYFMR